MSRAILEDEFNEWLHHPVTIEFRKVLAAKRADLRNEWEMSEPTAYLQQELILANVGNIGWCRGLAFAEQFTYETYLTELDDGNGKQVGAEAPRSSSVD